MVGNQSAPLGVVETIDDDVGAAQEFGDGFFVQRFVEALDFGAGRAKDARGDAFGFWGADFVAVENLGADVMLFDAVAVNDAQTGGAVTRQVVAE